MIYFLSLTQFPTNKAYGVTLLGTYKAALASGYQAEILSPNSLQAKNLTERLLLSMMKSLRKAYGGIPLIFTKIAFAIHKRIFFEFIKRQLSTSTQYIFWIRDLTLAHFLSIHFPQSKIVLELHQIQTAKALKMIENFSQNVILGPISEAVDLQLEFMRNQRHICRLPMGVAEYFFDASSGNSDENFQYEMGYFGSYKSSGFEQGIDGALIQLLPRFKESSNFKVIFSGIGEAGVKNLKKIAEHAGIEDRVVLREYVAHDLVPHEMRRCRTLLLPYPEGIYFQSRFPIKAMEYAAVKRPILCSRTISHQNLFDDDCVWFYDSDNQSGILNAYDQAQMNQIDSDNKIEKAYQLAKKYDFMERLKKVSFHFK